MKRWWVGGVLHHQRHRESHWILGVTYSNAMCVCCWELRLSLLWSSEVQQRPLDVMARTGQCPRTNLAATIQQLDSVSRSKSILLQAQFEPKFLSLCLSLSLSLHSPTLRRASLNLDFRGEEDALSFAVGGGYGLQLEEVQQNLNLLGHENKD